MSASEDRPTNQPQRTLRTSIGCVGVGLHSGARVALTLHPAPTSHGVRFRRADRPGTAAIPARFDCVVDTVQCTAIGLPGGPRVGMIEHLMAAIAACQLTNVLVEVTGPELPIMDGSAQPFVFLMECAGIDDQPEDRAVIEILRPVSVSSGSGWAALEPHPELVLECAVESAHALIGRQERTHGFRPDVFRAEIAPARTFALAATVEDLRLDASMPGASPKNVVVMAPDRVVNQEGLRFRDEFVRHRLLDSMGDLRLAGAELRGRYVGRRSGHDLDNRLLRAVFADPANWRPTAGSFVDVAGAADVFAAAHG